ncbi:MAG: GDP-mannose 4,6-dehydratase [Planctomycetota bacterium]
MTLNLVTGADGFVGQHLVAELLKQGEDVVGAVQRTPPRLTTLADEEAARVQWTAMDLERGDTVEALVDGVDADRVFHLAGLASPLASFGEPVSSLRVNVVGTLFLLEALARRRRTGKTDPVILISGSAHVYGAAASRYRPLTEESPLEPLSPYAVSKAAQEMLGLQYHRGFALPVIVTRSFNHTGPGQSPSFVAPHLAAQVHALRQGGGKGAVRLGNADARRDFTDVRDVVRAYVALTDRGRIGEVYNVCSGFSYAVRDLLAVLAGLAGVDVETETDPQSTRPADVPEMLGSYARLAADTGWSPQIEIRSSLADLLEEQGADG